MKKQILENYNKCSPVLAMINDEKTVSHWTDKVGGLMSGAEIKLSTGRKH